MGEQEKVGEPDEERVSRIVRALLDMAERANTARGASWEHGARSATTLTDAAALIGELTRLRAEVEQAHAVLDRAGVGPVGVLADRVRRLDAAGRPVRESVADRRAMREAHTEALAEVERLRARVAVERGETDRAKRDAAEYANRLDDERLKHGEALAEVERITRERDDDMAENAQLRAAIVAWNDYNEATSGHTIAQRAYDESESDERRSFWTDAILTQSAKWAAAMKRLDAMGAWRGSPTWKYI